jgi:hypothetical protein
MCFLQNFGSFAYPVSDTTVFFEKSTDQKQELPMVDMSVDGSGGNELFYRRPSIHASYLVSIHFAKLFQRRRFI